MIAHPSLATIEEKSMDACVQALAAHIWVLLARVEKLEARVAQLPSDTEESCPSKPEN
jgi:hypothetical protein